MNKNSWLIVANSSLARLFRFVTLRELEEIKVFEHPESRLHNLDFTTDRPGRDFESMGTGRHALEPKVLPKQQEFEEFAKQLADYLEQARQHGDFDTLYIAASPMLLGMLRQALNPNTTKLIKGEIDKDITHMPIREIPSYLPFHGNA